MISVLIPTYNYICLDLVSELSRQLVSNGVEYEIIVADDGSDDVGSIKENLKINDIPGSRYIIRKVNRGRSAIRNSLIDQSCGEWLWFIDSDMVITESDFVEKYLFARENGNDIICSGLETTPKPPTTFHSLRWKYDNPRVSRSKISAISFCFLAKKEVFDAVRFDERFSKYGYEDVLFAKSVIDRGFSVLTIDCPVLHNHIDDNESFLKKTETAIENAILFKRELAGIPIVDIPEKLGKYHLSPLVRLAFRISRPLLKKNLLGPRPSLLLFKFYKLGYFISNETVNQ